MLNAFKRPFEKETLDAWAKMADDVAKVAFLAIPVVLYGKETILFKGIHSALLLAGAYLMILGGRLIRKHKQSLDN